MSSRTQLSIVSPVYNAENIIPELVKRIVENVQSFTDDFEIVLVEDGSSDGSWHAIEEECRKSNYVKGIKLSRNFGQHYAISAGLKSAKNNYVVVMDCDLQDNPKHIKDLYITAKKGFDIVYTFKKERRHSFFKNIMATVFFYIFNYLVDAPISTANKQIGSFSILSRKAVDSFNDMKEVHRHYLMILRLIGFPSAMIEITHDKRFEGKSSYTFSKLIRHAVTGITSQSDKLLRVSISIGFFMFLISITWAALIITKYFMSGLLNGYASMMSFLLLGTGMVMMSIGITGIYIGKIFEQVKQRPLYFIDKTVNLEK